MKRVVLISKVVLISSGLYSGTLLYFKATVSLRNEIQCMPLSKKNAMRCFDTT